jgi:hypothetical protein
MKTLTSLVLTASLAFNVFLAFLLARSADREADELTARAAAEAAAAAKKNPGAPAIDPKLWASLQTDDLPTLVTRLREAGFPKDIVRAILSGLLNEQFAARRRALDPDEASRAFWKDRSPDTKLQLAQFQLYREQEKALRDLLGADANPTDPMTLARQRARFGNLPPEKMDAVQLLVSEFDRKRTENYYNTGSFSQTDNQRFDRELRSALAGVLSPAELEEYDLRSSNTGRSMRSDLIAFNPTEDEFRAVFKLRQPFDEQFSGMYNTGLPSQQQMSQREDAQKLLNEQIKALLGPDRGADYERAINYDYRRASQLIARLDLPADTGPKLWDIQQEYQKLRMDVFRSNPSVDERNAQLTAMQKEATEKIMPLLGSARAVEAYKQYGGSWLQNMVPRPPPTPAAPSKG